MKPRRKPNKLMPLEEIDREHLPPVKTAVTLSAEAHYRLKAACTHYRKDQSELVEFLVMEHLGGCFTSVRKPGSEASDAAA
jgi:hypothetical protein